MGSHREGFATSFWRGIRLQRRWGGEKNFLGLEQFFQVQAFQTEL